MNTPPTIHLHRYALIAKLAERLIGIRQQFGKTALQKFVYLLQEVYGLDCGYDFKLYTYGPFDSQLLGDLDLAAHWGYVNVQSIGMAMDGYHISPTAKADSIYEKAAVFLENEKTQKAIGDMVRTYGAMTARELEIRATTVYVERDLRRKGESTQREVICRLVGDIKMKFPRPEIEQAVDELNNRGHIKLAS